MTFWDFLSQNWFWTLIIIAIFWEQLVEGIQKIIRTWKGHE